MPFAALPLEAAAAPQGSGLNRAVAG